MSSSAPKAPAILNLYSTIRDILTPNQNYYYLIIESLIIGSLISGLFYTYIYPDIYYSISIVVSYLLISTSIYLFTSPEDIKKEYKVLRLKFNEILLISLIGLLPTIPIYIYNSSTISLQIISVLIYPATIYYRTIKYVSRRNFFIDEQSNNVDLWKYGSVYFERGVTNLQRDNMYRSFYAFKKASKIYEKLEAKEDRQSIKDGANKLSEATYLFSRLSFVDEPIEINRVKEKSDSYLNSANDDFQHRYCDNCNQKTHIENLILFPSENKSYEVYCQSCVEQMKQQKRKQEQRKHNEKQQYTNEKQQYTVKQISDAFEVLNISKPLTEDKINSAYKSKVKKAHPDVGGSDEEFKKVQESKEILLYVLENK